jgi:hypothetical protein
VGEPEGVGDDSLSAHTARPRWTWPRTLVYWARCAPRRSRARNRRRRQHGRPYLCASAMAREDPPVRRTSQAPQLGNPSHCQDRHRHEPDFRRDGFVPAATRGRHARLGAKQAPSRSGARCDPGRESSRFDRSWSPHHRTLSKLSTRFWSGETQALRHRFGPPPRGTRPPGTPRTQLSLNQAPDFSAAMRSSIGGCELNNPPKREGRGVMPKAATASGKCDPSERFRRRSAFTMLSRPAKLAPP